MKRLKAVAARLGLTGGLLDDPALPGLAAIRDTGLAKAVPALTLDDGPVELLLRRYRPGLRATYEARAGQRHFAVKAYALDPAPEVELYEALARAGVCVPPLLAWDRELRLVIIGWLGGPTAHQLVKDRQGTRAGELAARWLQRAASLSVKLGPPLDAANMLDHVRYWAASLGAADQALGVGATAVAGVLERTLPREGVPRLVNGSFYPRHVLDTGGDAGLIDWERFGQGPVEFDAGEFLANTWRIGLEHEELGGEAARAAEAFLAGTRGLLDERVVAWYRAATLVRLANKWTRRPGDGPARPHALLGEAARIGAAVC
jgi:hypothetical protein